MRPLITFCIAFLRISLGDWDIRSFVDSFGGFSVCGAITLTRFELIAARPLSEIVFTRRRSCDMEGEREEGDDDKNTPGCIVNGCMGGMASDND